MTVTHLQNGVNNVTASSQFANLQLLDPTKYAVFFEDFTETDFGDYPADSDAVALKYAVTLDTELDYDVSFGGATGALILTTEGGDTEGGQFRLNAVPFQLTAGKEAWFEAKLNITATTIGAESFFIGLSDNVAGTNMFADNGSAIAVDEAWGFVSIAAEAGIDVSIRDNDVETSSTDVGTFVSGTDVVLSLHYDGADTHAYVNGIKKAQVTGTHPTGDAMTVMVHFKSQSAEAKVLNLDYLLVAIER